MAYNQEKVDEYLRVTNSLHNDSLEEEEYDAMDAEADDLWYALSEQERIDAVVRFNDR